MRSCTQVTNTGRKLVGTRWVGHLNAYLSNKNLQLATSRREMHPDWDNSGWDFTKSNHSNRGTRHKYNSSRRPRFQDYEDSDDRHKHKVDVREGENLARTTTSFLAKDKSLPWGSRPDSGWHMTGKDSPEPWGITATDGGTGASWDAVCTTWGQPDQTGQLGAVPARPTTLTTTFLDVITPSPITSLSDKGRGKEKMKVDAMYEDKEVLRGLGLDLEVINTSVPVLEEPMGAIDPIPSKFATPSPSADWLKIPTGQRVKATRKRSDQGSLKRIPTVHENLTLKGLYEKHIRCDDCHHILVFELMSNPRGLYDAICIKTELEKIVQDEERWRRTRGSELYSRTSPWNKATVMHHRNVKNQKRIETEKRSQEIISNCAPYPELPPSNYYNLISVSNLEGIIMGYVSEIREWIESLQIHLHIPPTEDPDADQEIEGSSSKKLSPWEQLKITLNDIDSELEAMIMDFYSKQYLENIDVEEHVEKLLNDAIQKLRDVDAAQNELGAKGASVSKNEQTLAAQADLAAKLLEKIMMDEKEVKNLRAEKDANRQLERKVCARGKLEIPSDLSIHPDRKPICRNGTRAKGIFVPN